MIYRRAELEAQLRQWMAEALAGNQASYHALLSRIASMVRGYLTNTISPAQRTPEKVEDLVQDVLVAIHRKKHLYRTDMPILPWLFAIARYRLIDQVRADARRPSLVEWDDAPDPADPNATPVGHESVFELEELLDCLSQKQKKILVMAKAEGRPLAEIAAHFKMTLSAVKVTIHRSLQKVRERQRRMSGA
jgi:RNA polymerase sigma-70 factor (ECF subfamily)